MRTQLDLLAVGRVHSGFITSVQVVSRCDDSPPSLVRLQVEIRHKCTDRSSNSCSIKLAQLDDSPAIGRDQDDTR